MILKRILMKNTIQQPYQLEQDKDVLKLDNFYQKFTSQLVQDDNYISGLETSVFLYQLN